MVASSAPLTKTEVPWTSDREQAWRAFLDRYSEDDIVTGFVHRLKPFGAFVEFMPDQDGLVHRSQIIPGKLVVDVDEVLWPGDQVKATIKEIDHGRRRVNLSIADYLRHHRWSGSEQTASSSVHIDSRDADWMRDELALYEAELDATFEGLRVQADRIRRVLLIEDQLDLQRSLAALLQEAGFEVTVLGDAAAIGANSEDNWPDLIMLDAHGPATSGIEVSVHLCERYPDIPLILMSGTSLSDEERERLSCLDSVRLLHKPFQIQDLDALLNELDSNVDWTIESVPKEHSFERPSLPITTLDQLRRSVHELLQSLVFETGATAAAVFSMDLVTHTTEMLAASGISGGEFEQARHDLDISPVKDVIIDDEHIYETDASNSPGKFRYLLIMLDFQSLIGIPLTTAGSRRFGLFLFHTSAHQLTSRDNQRADHMASALNALIERFEAQRVLQTFQSFSLLGQLSAGLAHEVNNRVSAMAAQILLQRRDISQIIKVDALKQESTSDTLETLKKRALERLRRRALDMSGTIESLHKTAGLFQSLASPERQVASSLETVIERALQVLKATAGKHKIEVKVDPIPQLLHLRINDGVLEQVLVNLILNAIQQTHAHRQRYERQEGWVRIAVEDLGSEAELPFQILVEDSGPGIHRRWWDRVFDLGFSTREEGSGLGLFVARSFVRRLGGELKIKESAMLVGTTFVLSLPASESRGQT